MFSKQVENTTGKGKIACYEQFFLFPQCFQMACFSGASKGVIVWEWVNVLTHACTSSLHSILLKATGIFPTQSLLTLSQTSPGFHVSAEQVF